MKTIFSMAAFFALATPNSAALAQCGNDVTPTTKVALLQRAEALTKCSAFYHIMSVAAFGTQDAVGFKHWSKLSREALITSAMMVTTAGVPGSDPTTKFDEYQQSLSAPLEAGGSEWARGFSAECKTEFARARTVMGDYVEGR